jgi:hypothetical protein
MRWAPRALVILAFVASPRLATAESPEVLGQGETELAMPHFFPRHFLRFDGRRIESGLRIESSAQRVWVANKVFPAGGEPRGTALPEHLGGGFLFYQAVAIDGATYTAFYRSKTWTGELSPLGRVPFAVQYVAPGFDRVYALGVSLQVAFDVDTGQTLPLSPLPPLATITGLAFAGPRRALVSGPLVGVLATSDAGLTWGRVAGAEAIEVDLTGSNLFVRTAGGLSFVNDEGKAVSLQNINLDHGALRTIDFERLLEGQGGTDALDFGRVGSFGESSDEEVERSEHEDVSSRDSLERKWLAVLTRGVPFRDGAYALVEGELLHLRTSGDLTLESRATQVSPQATCLGTVEETGKVRRPLFVCRGKTLQAYRLEQPRARGGGGADGALELVFEGRRESEVLSCGNGGALLSGDCRGKNEKTRACHVSASGARALRLPTTFPPLGSPRAYAATSQKAHLVWFDRKAGKIKKLELSSPDAPEKKTQTWALPADHAVVEFLEEGALLPQASVTKDGVNFWATHREKFVGVQLGDSEKPSFGAVQRPLRRALFDGPRAMLWGAAGFAKQSVDGGQTFEELTVPYRSGDAELSAVDHARAAVTMGCSAVGCSLGRLLKLGWTLPQQTEEKVPGARSVRTPGLSRFRFTCGGLKRSPPRRTADKPSFPGFWENAAPSLPGGHEGSSVAFPGDLARFYAFGPADSSWSRTGRSQVMFVDPWEGLKLRATAPSLQLFQSSTDAKTRLGLVDLTSGFRFLSMDPGGRSGVMIFRNASSTELFVFEEGQPLEQFSGAHELGHRNLAGAVRARSSFVAAFVQGQVFSLVRLAGGAVQPLSEFNLGAGGQRGAQLVRTDGGDLGISIDGDDGLYVYPVSDQGELGDPLVVPHESQTPPACSSEASGYIIDRELAVSPYLETTTSRFINVGRVRAKMIVGYGKSCIDSLRAEARDLGELDGAPAPTASIVLSVFDADSEGRRSQLICE